MERMTATLPTAKDSDSRNQVLEEGGLAGEERRLLARLCLLPPGPVPGERLERLLMPHAGRAETRAMLNRQAEAGCVRLVRNVSGDTLVGLVPEKLTDLHLRLFGPLPLAGTPVREESREAKADLVLDMVTLLGLAADGPAKLSGKGGLPKRIGESWANRLTLTVESGRRIVAGRRAMLTLPDNAAVVLDLLLRAGLVAIRDGWLEPSADAVAGWMGKGDTGMRKAAYLLWLRAFAPEHPLARHVAWLLPAVPQGSWVDCAALERAWRDGLSALGLDGGDTAGWIEQLVPLREAGWLAFGETPDGATAIRPMYPLSTEDEGSSLPGFPFGGPLYVQPDFELLLPAGGSYALHAVLERFADLAAGGRMHVYRLTGRSVKRALGRGWSVKTILDVLGHAAAGGVPEEVVRGIRDWEKAAHRFRAEPAVLLRFSDAESADLFAGLEAFRPLLRDDNRLSPGIFVLREAEWVTFREAAGRAGEEVPDIRLPAAGVRNGAKKPGRPESVRFSGISPEDGGQPDAPGGVGESAPDSAPGSMSGSDRAPRPSDFRLAVVKAILARRQPGSPAADHPNTDSAGKTGPATNGACGGKSPDMAVQEAGDRAAAGGETSSEMPVQETVGRVAADRGISPEMPAQEAADFRPDPPPGLFPSPYGLDGYRPAPKWQTEELFPGFREVPSAWWKERCGGHPSTKLRMLRQAMKWGCRVEVERTGQPSGTRQAFTFLVTELAEAQDGCRIAGCGKDGPVRLALAEVETIRLILPGLSKINT